MVVTGVTETLLPGGNTAPLHPPGHSHSAGEPSAGAGSCLGYFKGSQLPHRPSRLVRVSPKPMIPPLS